MHILFSYICSWHLCPPLLLCSSLLSSQHIFISCPFSYSPAFSASFHISFPILSFILFLTFSVTPSFLLSPIQIQTFTSVLFSLLHFSPSGSSSQFFLLFSLFHLTSAFHSFLTPLIISPPLVLLLLHRFPPVLSLSHVFPLLARP